MTDDNVYEITNVPPKREPMKIDVSKLPAPDLVDTRTDETEAEFLSTMFTPEQIEELRDTIRFTAAAHDGDPTDMDLADVVEFFHNAGWTQPLAGLQ